LRHQEPRTLNPCGLLMVALAGDGPEAVNLTDYFFVRPLVSGAVYIAVTRSLNVPRELAFIDSSPEIASTVTKEENR
jgi:hypothetical protein